VGRLLQTLFWRPQSLLRELLGRSPPPDEATLAGVLLRLTAGQAGRLAAQATQQLLTAASCAPDEALLRRLLVALLDPAGAGAEALDAENCAQMLEVALFHRRTRLDALPWTSIAFCVGRHPLFGPTGKRLWQQTRNLRDALQADLNATAAAPEPPQGPRGAVAVALLALASARFVPNWLTDLETLSAEQRQAWQALLAACTRYAPDHGPPGPALKPKVLKAFLAATDGPAASIGAAELHSRLRAWLGAVRSSEEFVGHGARVLAALLLVAGRHGDESLGPPILRLAELAYRDSPNESIGAPAMVALTLLPKGCGLPLLLAARLKRRQGQNRRDRVLEKLARRRRISVEALADQPFASFGLDGDGRRETPLGEGRLLLTLGGPRQARVAWIDARGKERKTVPAAAKEAAGDRLQQLAREAKDISGLLAGHAQRLERSYLQDRRWEPRAFLERFAADPLHRHLARRLIWVPEGDERLPSVVLPAGEPRTVAGERLDPGRIRRLRLWHPLTDDEAPAWRERIEAERWVQPFRQAHRESYRLTDAEAATASYSNRFAGHILRQHQLRALAHQGGWRYGLQGAFDGDNDPELSLPAYEMNTIYCVEVPPWQREQGLGVARLVTTDRVIFRRGNVPLPLAEIPPLVFSEVMRQVDLFVSASSIGANPDWQDRGADDLVAGYWRTYAAAPLSEADLERRALLARLLPQLAIAGRLTLEDRWLLVRGTLAQYRIHLRSHQVQVDPGGHHLCIVPARGRQPDLYLPYDGDADLAAILSKAHLLAADDRVADPGIREQVRQAVAAQQSLPPDGA